MAEQSIPAARKLVTRSEAKALGLTKYWTGTPCGRGHISERRTANRFCTACAVLASGQHDAANPEKKRARTRAHYLANAEAIKAKQKADPQKKRVRDRARYAANPDKARNQARAWRVAHPETCRATDKAWRQANPDATRAMKQNRRALLAKAEGSHNADDILVLRAKQHNKCAYCIKPLKPGWHVDHVVPLSKGGSNWPSNLALACEPCNLRKHVKLPHEFARERGLLF